MLIFTVFHEDALNVLSLFIRKKIESFFVTDYLGKLYKAKFNFLYEKYDSLPNIDSVAKSLESDAAHFFIELDYVEKTVKTLVQPSTIRVLRYLATQTTVKPEYKEETQTVVNLFNISEEVPYTIISIDLEPQYPNIPKFNLTLIYAFSKVHIQLFYSFNIYKEATWGEFQLDEIKWRNSERFFIKREEDIELRIEAIKFQFKYFVEKHLKELSKSQLDQEEDNSEIDDTKKGEEAALQTVSDN